MSKKQEPTQGLVGALEKKAEDYTEKFADVQTSVYQVQASLRLLSQIFEEYTTPTKGMSLDQVDEILGLVNLCHESLHAQDGQMELLARKFDEIKPGG